MLSLTSIVKFKVFMLPHLPLFQSQTATFTLYMVILPCCTHQLAVHTNRHVLYSFAYRLHTYMPYSTTPTSLHACWNAKTCWPDLTCSCSGIQQQQQPGSSLCPMNPINNMSKWIRSIWSSHFGGSGQVSPGQITYVWPGQVSIRVSLACMHAWV